MILLEPTAVEWVLQHDFSDVDVHGNSPVFERRGNEAAERERRHDAEGEGEQRVCSRQNRVHLEIAATPTGMIRKTSGTSITDVMLAM